MGTIKPKGLNKIAKICHGHLCLKGDNLSFNNNYPYLGTVNFNDEYKSCLLSNVSVESLTIEWVLPSGTNRPLAEESVDPVINNENVDI